MVVEEKLRSKTLYRTELCLIKVIPMIIAGIYLTNTILSYFGIDLVILSVIGGMSLLPLLFLYISSYVFKFCPYHRMFLHYIVVNDCLNYLDYYMENGLCSERAFLLINMVIAGAFMYIILYMKFGHEHIKKYNTKGARFSEEENRF